MVDEEKLTVVSQILSYTGYHITIQKWDALADLGTVLKQLCSRIEDIVPVEEFDLQKWDIISWADKFLANLIITPSEKLIKLPTIVVFNKSLLTPAATAPTSRGSPGVTGRCRTLAALRGFFMVAILSVSKSTCR